MPRAPEHQGDRFTIVCGKRSDGSCPSGDFLDGLDPADRRKFKVLFVRLGDHGSITNDEHFKKLEGTDGLWEFKRHQLRLFCFFGKNAVVYLVDGLRKKKDKHRRADIARAEQYKADIERHQD